MGGATENDSASVWFLQRAQSGDVVVLRATGTDGYNDYFYNQLGQSLNSVETLLLNDSSAAYEPYVIQRIAEAEALFFAGGNQWTYVREWRNTPLDSAVRYIQSQRNAAVGGTSAGMAILGGIYNTAENGSLTSTEALSDPFHPNSTLDSALFVAPEPLKGILTDTHFDNPDRRGRLISWMARVWVDRNANQPVFPVYAIACEEYTAVCIEPGGWARVFGDAPTYDDKAWFFTTNCGLLPDAGPERCTPGQTLDWVRNQQALLAYTVEGTLAGNRGFDLNDWKTGTGGQWTRFWVSNGQLQSAAAVAPDCTFGEAEAALNAVELRVYAEPDGSFSWSYSEELHSGLQLELYDARGARLDETDASSGRIGAHLEPGLYTLRMEHQGRSGWVKLWLPH